MIVVARNWWADRSVRERAMLSVMAAALFLFAGWFAIVSPLVSGARAALARHDEAVANIATVKVKVAALKSLTGAAPAPLGAPVSAFVDQSATDAGFQLVRADSVGTDSVAVTIAAVKSPALFGWIALLDRRGIFVERLTIRTNSDATLAVEATLKAREI